MISNSQLNMAKSSSEKKLPSSHTSIEVPNIKAVIKLNDATLPIELRQTTFPTGEINVTVSTTGINPFSLPKRGHVDSHFWKAEIHVYALLHNSDNIITLGLVKSAIDKLLDWDYDIVLITPYLPYARQDKIHHPGEGYSFKVFSAILNSYKFSKIITYDTHNVEKANVLIKNLQHIDVPLIAHSIINELTPADGRIVVINIDAGAKRKNIAAYLNLLDFRKEVNKQLAASGNIFHYNPLVENNSDAPIPDLDFCKTRTLDGDIEFMYDNVSPWYRHLYNSDELLVVDDICDGGKTFIEFAKYIKSSDKEFFKRKLHLHVTHGFFTRGMETINALLEYYDTIHYTFYYNKEILTALYEDNSCAVRGKLNQLHEGYSDNSILIPKQLYELIRLNPPI